MKKVRFESPVKTLRINAMNSDFQRECHSPRPFIMKQVQSAPLFAPMNYLEHRPIPFTNDPVQRFECGDSTPYPLVNKTYLSDIPNTEKQSYSPSNELDLSMLDSTYNKPKQMLPRQNILNSYQMQSLKSNFNVNPLVENKSTRILTPVENNIASSPPNVLSKKDDFFLRRDNLTDLKNIQSQFNNLHLDKENNPLLKKTEIMTLGIPISNKMDMKPTEPSNCTSEMNHFCKCYHCVHILNTQGNMKHFMNDEFKHQYMAENHYNICHCRAPLFKRNSDCQCNNYSPINHTYFPPCTCNKTPAKSPQTGVSKKNWTLEKYEQSNKPSTCLDIEKQDKIVKEKREPTVADLFKIIKLQNEQLQLLQEKVDKFISASKTYEPQKITQPLQNYVTEHVEVKSIGTEEKISIGVMTSFEMYRTSTIINKEIVKQNEAQIQCNRSQISIKEVVTKAHPVNLNFLDGIAPVSNSSEPKVNENTSQEIGDLTKNTDTGYVDKTLNDMSLYNVQVDNPITPLMSPEQSLYLDVRDYSDSDTSDDQSNVGWTYYNKVMTHVNGMLQESDMPSSASALYRNNRQKCLQMQIDKTNISVAKRVTFGDDPLGYQVEQPQLHAPTTDTSLKMNQLAAKYLKNGPQISKSPSPKPGAVPVDMSLATRNYMEKHKLLQGNNKYQNGQQQAEIPKFLDITALKQQPKFL